MNNAGASWGARLDEFPENGWDKVMDTNVKGVFFLTQRLLPLLEAAATADSPARVINIGSIDGIRPSIFDAFSYGPSKAAVHMLTRQLAAPLARRNILSTRSRRARSRPGCSAPESAGAATSRPPTGPR